MTRHIPIAEIAAAVHRSDDLVKALAMLRAYFDDSGTHGESLITAISGFMAPANVWHRVERDWLEALADYRSRYGVTWYHAADVANWQGEWRGAPLNVCRAAPMQFAAVLGKANVLPVWAAVVNDDYKQYATPEFIARFPTPFDLCFHEAMGQLYRWCKENLNATRVIPSVAHGDYLGRVVAAHRRYRGDGDFSEYIGPLVIDTPQSVVPLQAADLLAYEFYQWWKDTEYPSDPSSFKGRPTLDKAIERNAAAMRGACYSGNGMRLAVVRFMEREQERQKGGRDEGG
jgi:hypothetical protein